MLSIFMGLMFLFLSAVLIGCATVAYFLIRGDTITLGQSDAICQYMKNELTETDKRMQEQSSLNTGG